jgi:protein gp37
LPNVWIGVSVENQEYADERIPSLLDTPAAVRFLSVEPLLGPVDLHAIQIPGERAGLRFSALSRQHDARYGSSDTALDWVIVGGESGPGAREMKPEWVRRIRDDVTDAGAALFFKQWGGVRKKLAGRELDGRTWDEFPSGLTAPGGSDGK